MAEKSSLGIDENIVSVLAYVLGIIGIIFYFIEKKSRMVRFHSLQSALFAVAVMILSFAMVPLSIISSFLGPVACVTGILMFAIAGIAVIVWLFLLWKAFNNEMFKLPIIGDIAEKNAEIRA